MSCHRDTEAQKSSVSLCFCGNVFLSSSTKKPGNNYKGKNMQAIKIYKTSEGIVVQQGDDFFLSTEADWDKFINRQDLFKKVTDDINSLKANNDLSEMIASNFIAPISGQESWAAGVTYLRSREARMEESKDAGGGDFYAKVCEASRPELFFKAPSYRTVGSGQIVRIRKDSHWHFPAPAPTLFICAQRKL